MKKIFIFFISIVGLFFTACNPLDNIYETIDAKQNTTDLEAAFLKNLKTAPAAYTLTDADYALSSNADVSKYKNFSATVLPKDYLPEILNKKFSGQNAQSMMVTYNFYSKPVVDKVNAYTVQSAEYTEMGQKYSNFTDANVAQALIGKLLDRKVYADAIGAEKTAMYVLYKTNQTRYIRVNADFTAEVLTSSSSAVAVTADQYTAMGNGKYKNFDDIDQAQTRLAILTQTEGTAPITYSCAVYKNYLDTYVVYIYNGSNWVVKQSLMPVSEELNYSLDQTDITKSYWWADPAIKVTLNSVDYALFPGSGDDGGTAKYGNFDLRGGKIPGTDTAKLIEMLGAMLVANHSAVDNQQYLVFYAYYDGSNGVASKRILKTGSTWAEVPAN